MLARITYMIRTVPPRVASVPAHSRFIVARLGFGVEPFTQIEILTSSCQVVGAFSEWDLEGQNASASFPGALIVISPGSQLGLSQRSVSAEEAQQTDACPASPSPGRSARPS